MASRQPSSVNIYELIEQRHIEIVFQPVVSIRRGTIVGVEALSRGISGNGRHVPPTQLFNLAKISGFTYELDRLCRMMAVESFLPLHAANPELILFMNVETAALDQIAAGADSFVNFLQHNQLNPQNVAIEIVESEFGSSAQLLEIIDRNKQYGFLTVLDDVGVKHSNLDRIAQVKPDILKVDRSLVRNLHTNSHQQEVLKALVNLAERTGGWVIIEGVEQQEEAIHALDMGADMLEGFLFSQPHRVDSLADICLDQSRIQEVAVKFKNHTIDKTRLQQAQRQQRLEILQAIAAQLQTVQAEMFDRTLSELLSHYSIVESACVLNSEGTQVTETIRNLRQDEKQKTIIFKPPAQGTNHSLKEYYYLLMEAQIDPFETDPYVPLPSSNLCVTVSTQFENIDRSKFVLCLHIQSNAA